MRQTGTVNAGRSETVRLPGCAAPLMPLSAPYAPLFPFYLSMPLNAHSCVSMLLKTYLCLLILCYNFSHAESVPPSMKFIRESLKVWLECVSTLGEGKGVREGRRKRYWGRRKRILVMLGKLYTENYDGFNCI